MDKKKRLQILMNLIFIVVFNVCFFIVLGLNHRSSGWISYIFIHISYIMLICTPFFVRETKNKLVIGFPLYKISQNYFILTLTSGLIFILWNLESYKISLTIHLILSGVYGVLLLANMIANEHTVDNIEKQSLELIYVKDASSRLKSILSYIDDRKLYKKIERVYDLLHSSPSKSNESVRHYELTVLELIDILEHNVEVGDVSEIELTIKKIERNASERNNKLKYTV